MLTKSGMADIDRITKFADSLGHSTEMISGLELSAKLAGASASQLQTGMKKLTDVFSDAASGNQAAIDKFTAMGLSIDDLTAMNADERFLAISDAIAAMENPTDQARASIELFGKQGVDLINLLRQGSGALKDQQAEAAKLGLVFDRQAAAKVEMANDAMAKMAAIAQGVGRTLAVELAPYVTALANAMTGFATENVNAGDLVVSALEWIATGVAKVAGVIDLLKAAWYGLQTAATAVITGLVQGLETLAKGIDFVSEAIGLGTTGIGESLTMLKDELAATTEDLADKTKEAWDNFTSGSREKQVKEFFAKVREEADAAAAATAAAAEERANFQRLAEEALAADQSAAAQQVSSAQVEAAQSQAAPSATATALLAGSAQAVIAQKQAELAGQHADKKREEQLAELIRQNAEILLSLATSAGDLLT